MECSIYIFYVLKKKCTSYRCNILRKTKRYERRAILIITTSMRTRCSRCIAVTKKRRENHFNPLRVRARISVRATVPHRTCFPRSCIHRTCLMHMDIYIYTHNIYVATRATRSRRERRAGAVRHHRRRSITR